jgi:hypothetical protein
MQDLFSYDQIHDVMSATHDALKCGCACNGSNSISPSTNLQKEETESSHGFPNSRELTLWEHYASPICPTLLSVGLA